MILNCNSNFEKYNLPKSPLAVDDRRHQARYNEIVS